jgi:hypothetical protein
MRKLFLLILCLSLTACSLSQAKPQDDINNQAATLVAMTLNAFSHTPAPTNTPLPSPTRSATGTPTPTITPTYSTPILKINEATNCRTGPGQSFDILFTFNPGATAEIMGYYPTSNYWTVKVPGRNDPCWVWGEYATASGSSWAVPTVNPPASVTPSPPTSPGIASWDYLCGYSGSGPNATVNLKWTDRADDESGYRISPNSDAYSEVIDVTEGEKITYLIEAFNGAGASSSSPIEFTCQ